MDTILHVVEIHAPPDKVFAAIATGAGLSSWWSTRVAADEKLGGSVKFSFIPGFNPEMKITELKPSAAVGWRCVGGADPWQDAAIRFDIEALRPDHSQLTFRQSYAGDMPDLAFGTFNFNWAYYLRSLQQYVETGTGFPHAAP